MAFSEEYYLRMRGEQRGPYTARQIERLYQKGFVPSEALYWRDGMEQWESVTDLLSAAMQPRVPRRRMNWPLASAAIVVAGVLLWILAPTLRDGWKEANAHEFKAEAAYWKARGFVREDLRGGKSTVAFAPFEASSVTLTDGTLAKVTLHGTVFKTDNSNAVTEWHVAMEFRLKKKQWMLLEKN